MTASRSTGPGAACSASGLRGSLIRSPRGDTRGRGSRVPRGSPCARTRSACVRRSAAPTPPRSPARSRGAASSTSRICRAYSSQSVARRSIPPSRSGARGDRRELRRDEAALGVLGLVPRVGEEHPQLRDGCRWQQVLEHLGRVRLDEAEVAHAGAVGVEHRAGEAGAEDLDGEEVEVGTGCRGVDDRVPLPRADLDHERRGASPDRGGIDRRVRDGCSSPRRRAARRSRRAARARSTRAPAPPTSCRCGARTRRVARGTAAIGGSGIGGLTPSQATRRPPPRLTGSRDATTPLSDVGLSPASRSR